MLCEQWVLRTFLSIRHSTYDGDDSGYFDDGATWEARDPVMVRNSHTQLIIVIGLLNAENQPPRHTSRAT